MRAYSTQHAHRRKGNDAADRKTGPPATPPGHRLFPGLPAEPPGPAPPPTATPDAAFTTRGGAARNDTTARPDFGPLPVDLSTLGLPANALLLLDKLRFFYCRTRPFCWPSDAELVRRTGLSIHQVRRGLRRLEHDGLICRQTTARRLDDGRVRRHRFIDLLFTAPGAGARAYA